MRLLAIILLSLCSSPVFACANDEYIWSNIQNSERRQVSGPFSIAELESMHMVKIRETREVLPFGYNNGEWEKLKSQYVQGDQIYFVRYEDGAYFAEHYVLVRRECAIGALLQAVK